MNVITDYQAKQYLKRITDGKPVKPNVAGFFWGLDSDDKECYVVFKAKSILEFWYVQTEKEAIQIIQKK